MMLDFDGRVALVAFLRRADAPPGDLAELLETVRDPRQLLDASVEATTSLFPDDPAPLLEAAHAEVAAWERSGLRLLSVLDEDYPINLRMVHDRPPLLFLHGQTAHLADPRAIAIVGSRKATARGRETAAAIASEFVAAGYVVVSGLATGIDTSAHEAAVAAADGRTIAVIPTGHEHAYPPANRELQAEIGRAHAVVSPFWPLASAHPDRFRRRNGVMSGLSRGTVIVEASVRSGTRVQARLALAHGRPVFLARQLLAQPWAAELAERPGVHVFDTPADVLTATDRLNETGAPTNPDGPPA